MPTENGGAIIPESHDVLRLPLLDYVIEGGSKLNDRPWSSPEEIRLETDSHRDVGGQAIGRHEDHADVTIRDAKSGPERNDVGSGENVSLELSARVDSGQHIGEQVGAQKLSKFREWRTR